MSIDAAEDGMEKSMNPDTILISVITVVYNDVHKLESTILSYINQKYRNTEFIIIDGGSTDGTIEIIRKYKAYLTYWISEPDKGIYDAMNKGLKIAKGEYIYFLNSGDSFVNENVLNNASIAIEKTHSNILCGKVFVTTGPGHNNVIDTFPKYKLKEENFRRLFNSCFCHQALFVSRKSYLEVGGFEAKFKFFADFFAISRIIKLSKPPEYIELIVAFFNGEGVSSNWHFVKDLENEKKEIFKLLGEDKSALYYLMKSAKTELFIIKKKLENAWFNK
jgi:putative colanic acid biosynthesis glycosyltransferase